MRASGVSLPSVKRLERKPGPLSGRAKTVEALRAALEAAGVEFTNGDQPGVRKGGVGTRFAAGEFASSGTGLAGVGTRFAAGEFASSGTGLAGVGTRFAAGEFARQLRELTDWARAEVPSEEELLEGVEAISPALAEKIAPLLKRKEGVFFVIAVIVWIISHVNLEIDLKATVDINHIFASAVSAIDGQSIADTSTASHSVQTPGPASVSINVEQNLSLSLETERQTKRQMHRATYDKKVKFKKEEPKTVIPHGKAATAGAGVRSKPKPRGRGR